MSHHSQSKTGPSLSQSPELEVTYIDEVGGRAPSTSERRLMLAILRRALWDFAQYKDPKSKNHDLHVDAAGWLFWDGQETSDEEGRVTYHYVCEVLDFDPAVIRHGAKILTRERIRKISQRIEET